MFIFGIISGFSLLIAMFLWLAQWRDTENIMLILHAERAKTASTFVTPDAVSQQKTDLPEFDSAGFVRALSQVAEKTFLPINEVSFALENADNQPFMRYRVKLSVSSDYPVIRHFIDLFRSEWPHISLDAIVCKREKVTETNPSCELAFSAFYRKRING